MAYSGRCFLSKFFTHTTFSSKDKKVRGRAERNANLGDCIQPCRWNYKTQLRASRPHPSPPLGKGREFNIIPDGRDEVLEIVEEAHGSYILNSQDLCLIKKLDQLIKAGISGFKIEGRAKSVYYIANVVGAYRKAIDANLRQMTPKIKEEIDFLYKELEDKLYHRGYTEGFMFSPRFGEAGGKGKLAQNLDNSHKKCKWEFCGSVIRSKK